MRSTYNPDADAVYVHLTDEPLGPQHLTTRGEVPQGVDALVVLDWNHGRLVGVEVIGASVAVHDDLIARSRRI